MKKICVVTSTRAEYGIMSNLINKIALDQDLVLQLVVTGSHLSEKFGYTYREITAPITKKIDIEIDQHPSHAMSVAIEKFYGTFTELKPDVLLVLGDRYEIMAVAIAAMLNNISIGHICGGESTEGVIDEAIRHSITKMSHLHFASCEEYRNRIIQLGENPRYVFNVGSLSVENIEKTQLLSKEILENELNFKFGEKNLLVTFHPVTLENNTVSLQFMELLNALSELKDTKIIFTKPNSDAGNAEIFKLIDDYVLSHEDTVSFTSLGMLKYFSVLQFIDGVIGNSSSGIVEVPSFMIGTINIGDRQKGRIQAKSVINCGSTKEEILAALGKLYSAEFQQILKGLVNFYKQKDTADRIIRVLKEVDTSKLLKKEFYNLEIA
ncbi:MAG: UDP-N-acetylglucosamine 2-epimerase [Holosporaceae bacterium]|jgi:GDP/UDP-N,N'-diacetylbacillosamine 2-epimerase (hydrolysing)|nr:UDP-N-acetylglucosamine 2-epimerase [Holosporaceae bacterium]